jgi:hypothetical protein
VIIAPRISGGFARAGFAGGARPKGRFNAVCEATGRQRALSAAQTDAAAPTHLQGRRMSNFVIAIAVFLITVIGALFAIPYFVDWNGYRSAFE